MQYLKVFSYRHTLSVSIAVLAAIIINFYYAFSHAGWIVIVALLVSQTTRGTAFQQSIYYSLIILAAIVSACLLKAAIQLPVVCEVSAIILFLLSGWATYVNRPMQYTTFFFIILFPLVFLLAVLLPENGNNLLHDWTMDAIIGAAIGVLCGQLILPARADQEFIRGLLPILNALAAYSHALGEYFLQDDKSDSNLIEKKLNIENILQSQREMYPEWVYEVGFNPGLRSGFRFFLIQIERVTEIFFSLHYLVVTHIKDNLASDMLPLIATAAEVNAELIDALALRLNEKTVADVNVDYTEDMNKLESAAQSYIPGGLDMLSFSDEYTKITMLIRDLKDARTLLLQLLMALPDKK